MARISRREWCRRIVEYLRWAESKEPDTHLRDDYSMARMTVAKAAQGAKYPFRDACLDYLGLMPEKVWPKIVERRKAKLGNCYSFFYDENDLRRPSGWENFYEQQLPPKKSAQSEKFRAVESARKVSGVAVWPKKQTAEKADFLGGSDSLKDQAMASTATQYRNSESSASEIIAATLCLSCGIPSSHLLCNDCLRRGHRSECPSPRSDCTCGFSEMFWRDVCVRVAGLVLLLALALPKFAESRNALRETEMRRPLLLHAIAVRAPQGRRGGFDFPEPGKSGFSGEGF